MWSWQTIVIGLTLACSTFSLPQNYQNYNYDYNQQYNDYERARAAYIRRLESGVESAARSGRAVDAMVLEDRLEESILAHARDSAARDAQDPVRAARDLQEIQDEWRRDKRAVDFISGLVGSSSGGGGHPDSAGGGGGGGSGSDSGSILNLVGPLLGSSSGGSGGGGGGDDGSGGGGGGSGSGSILNLVGPLLGSSSGGGGGGGGAGGDAGSGSGSILNLIGPLLGSSSGSSGGGGGGDGNSAGGSDLSSILGISNSSGGGSGSSGGGDHAGGGAGIGGAVNAVKFGFLQDTIQLLLRLKFGVLTKILNSISAALAAASNPTHVPIDQLKYPDP